MFTQEIFRLTYDIITKNIQLLKKIVYQKLYTKYQYYTVYDIISIVYCTFLYAGPKMYIIYTDYLSRLLAYFNKSRRRVFTNNIHCYILHTYYTIIIKAVI